MAHSLQTHRSPFVFDALVQFGAGVWNVFTSIGEAQSLHRRYMALNNLSDADLAERGLKREDLAYHVFAHHI